MPARVRVQQVTVRVLVDRLYAIEPDETAWMQILDDWVLDVCIYVVPKQKAGLVLKALIDCELATARRCLSGPATNAQFMLRVVDHWQACDRWRIE